MSAKVGDKVMEKIEKYANEVINYLLNNDKTILISVNNLLKKDKIFDALKYYNIQCEKGEIERKDFYYILPKCFYFSERLLGIGLVHQSGVLYNYTTRQLEQLKHSIKLTLTLLVLVKSKTFFEVYVNNFLDDNEFSYFIVYSKDFSIVNEAIKSPEFSRYLALSNLRVKIFGDVYVIAYEPKIPFAPKYAILQIADVTFRPDHIESELDIIEISKEEAYQIISKAFDDVKKEVEDAINKNEQLQKLISQILDDSESS